MNHIYKHHKKSLLAVFILLILLAICVIGGTAFSWFCVFFLNNDYLEAAGTWTIGDITILIGFIYFLYDSGTDLSVYFSTYPTDNQFHFSVLNKNKKAVAYRLFGIYNSTSKPKQRTIKNILKDESNDQNKNFINEFELTNRYNDLEVIPPYSVSNNKTINPEILNSYIEKKKNFLTIILVSDAGKPYTFTSEYHHN